METLNTSTSRAKEEELFRGLKVGAREQVKEITHLFFVDDTVVFC